MEAIKKISGSQGLEAGKDKSGAQDLLGNETTLYDTTMVDTCR